MSISSFLSRNYWRFGFGSRLYDLLIPEAYLYALERAVECAPDGEERVWFDAGCGSGILISSLKRQLLSGDIYIGTDILYSGLSIARKRSRKLGLPHRTLVFQNDMTRSIPIVLKTPNVIVAFFSLYTIPDPEKRTQTLKYFQSILKPGGCLILVSPSKGHSTRRIIKTSVEIAKRKNSAHKAWIREWLILPLTFFIGLNIVEHQLRNNEWKAYSLDELCWEIKSAGFKIKFTESVYGESAFLVVAE